VLHFCVSLAQNVTCPICKLDSHPSRKYRSRMGDYRVYFIDADGHFYDVIILICRDDADAIAQAERLTAGKPAELWLLDRKVATLPGQKPTA
jgi:hypothetical protein